MRVQLFERSHLPRLLELVNIHLAATIPGWSFSEEFLAGHLRRNYTEYITDPWVEERKTLCVVEGYRMLAAIHLLRYGAGPEVGHDYREAGEVDWFVALPERNEATAEVLAAARDCFAGWGVKKEYGWSHGLPIVPMWGVPDCWPHIAEALFAAGYQPPPCHPPEALYGGRLDGVPAVAKAPVADVTVQRTVSPDGVRFSATLDGEEVGFCEVAPDLTCGGVLPALRSWAGLQEMQVREEWRNRGIGGWLIEHAAAWLRLAGCDRIVLCVASSNEAAGAGRFYRRFGWRVLVRELCPQTGSSVTGARKESRQ